MKKPDVRAIAQSIVAVMPLVMRAIAAERQWSGHAMPPAHFRLLMILASHSCNLSELAVRHGVSLPTMSNSISVLVERGWVKRAPAPGDRRQVLLELTPDGLSALSEIKSQAEARVAKLLGKLSPDDLESLSAGLSVLEQAFAPAMCSRPNSHAQERIRYGQK